MKYLKYTFECLVTGFLVAIVVHGMVVLGAWLTLGLWLNEGGQYWYAFIASVAMFACLYALFESVILKITSKRWYQYKVAPYALITILGIFPALVWSVYEFNHSGSLKLTVIEDRQPLFTIESDGAVQNEYQLDIVNETTKDIQVLFSTASDLQGLVIAGTETPLLVHHGEVNSYTIFIKLPEKYITHKTTDIVFIVKNIADATMQAKYKTTFNEPEADSNNQ
jgi:IG-like fold at C-terminal of FixG, putative oxidoreductase